MQEYDNDDAPSDPLSGTFNRPNTPTPAREISQEEKDARRRASQRLAKMTYLLSSMGASLMKPSKAPKRASRRVRK